MGFKISKIKRGIKHWMSSKALRKKLGLTGKSRHMRQLKRSLKFGRRSLHDLVSGQPTSAESYTYTPKTLSQLTGGV